MIRKPIKTAPGPTHGSARGSVIYSRFAAAVCCNKIENYKKIMIRA
jgi:hypothetical protein